MAATPAPHGPGLPYRAPRADDARHSVLSRIRPLSQTSLGAFAELAGGQQPLLPRDDFGTYEVREVDAKSALTVCRMPGEPWALNPYMGCSHDCAYCYVPDVAHVERWRWGSYVVVKRNLPTLLSHEVRSKARREVFVSSATDPYQPVEGTHLVTQRCLEVLARVDWPVYVLTRNPLVRRDVHILKRFTDCSAGMSVPTLDDEMRRLVEPGAPTIEARLRTLRALADEGLDTFANICPAYPLSGGVTPRDIALAFREAGVKLVHVSPWRYLGSVLPVLKERLPPEDYDVFSRAVLDARYYQRLFRQLHAAFRGTGVALGTMESEPSMGPNRLDWS